MATIEERTSSLEARMDELTRTTTEIKSMLVALDQKMDRRFDAFEARVEGRFGAMEGRFTSLETRFDARFGGVDARFGGLETRTSHLFVSMITLQIMTLLAIVGGLFGIITKLM